MFNFKKELIILTYILLTILSASEVQAVGEEYFLKTPFRDAGINPSSAYEFAPSIIYYNNKYRMYYCSPSSVENRTLSWDSIRYAESSDGINWQMKGGPVGTGEVLRSANTDKSMSTCDPSAILFNNRIYLYYTDCPRKQNNDDDSCWNTPNGDPTRALGRIAVARSVGNPLDDESWYGAFEKYTVRNQWVQYDFSTSAPNGGDNTDYPKMLIHPDCFQGGVSNCGLITVKYGQGQQTVVNRNGTLHMWWFDDTVFNPPSRKYKLKYATSTDGVNFSTPVTIEAPAGFGIGVWGGSSNVVWDDLNQRFVLFTAHMYQGNDTRGLYLTSPDGIHWSDLKIFIPAGQIPAEANNPGISSDIYGNLLPDNFLFGINSKLDVSQGRLMFANVGVNVAPSATPTAAPIPVHCSPLGDIDCSRTVDAEDLRLLAVNYGTTEQKNDLDDSGNVNSLDFTILMSNFGQTSIPPTATPSPTLPPPTATLVPDPPTPTFTITLTPTPTSTPTPMFVAIKTFSQSQEPDSIFLQSLVSEDGGKIYYRHYVGSAWEAWDANRYTNVSTMGGFNGAITQIRSFSQALEPNGTYAQYLVSSDGTKIYYRHYVGSAWEAWDVNRYTSIPKMNGIGGAISQIRSVSQSQNPDNTFKQFLVSEDGGKIYYRHYVGSAWEAWDANRYTNVSTMGGFNGVVTSILSFDQSRDPDGVYKQSLLSSDGTKIYYRHYVGSAWETWDVNRYTNVSAMH